MSYGPAATLTAFGTAMLTFGILDSTDAGTVAGIVLGTMVAGVGIMRAVEIHRSRQPRTSRRTRDRIDRTRDRSTEPPRAARRFPNDRWLT